MPSVGTGKKPPEGWWTLAAASLVSTHTNVFFLGLGLHSLYMQTEKTEAQRRTHRTHPTAHTSFSPFSNLHKPWVKKHRRESKSGTSAWKYLPAQLHTLRFLFCPQRRSRPGVSGPEGIPTTVPHATSTRHGVKPWHTLALWLPASSLTPSFLSHKMQVIGLLWKKGWQEELCETDRCYI